MTTTDTSASASTATNPETPAATTAGAHRAAHRKADGGNRTERHPRRAENGGRAERYGRRAEKPGDPNATTPAWWVRTIASWLLLFAMVALLLALVVVPRLTGSTAYTVLTGSMKPGLPPGTLIVSKPAPAEDLQAGDVITFQPYSGNPEVVTHRIDGIFYDSHGDMRIYTKGDANETRDSWVLQPAQVRGKLLYSVPYLGHVNNLLGQGDRSTLIYVVGGGLLAYAAWAGTSEMRDKLRGRGPQSPGSGSSRPDEEEGTTNVSV